MKHCIELSSDEDAQLSDYIHARYGARSHGKVSVVLREALREYLSNHAIVQSILQKSTAAARIDKPEKETFAAEGPEPRGSNRAGPLPLEVRDPAKAKEILDFYAGGEARGGHSRRKTAEKFGVGEGQVSHLWKRRNADK